MLVQDQWKWVGHIKQEQLNFNLVESSNVWAKNIEHI